VRPMPLLEMHDVLECACRADQATEITYAFAQYVNAEAEARGVPHYFLGDADANPEKVAQRLGMRPSAFFHFDHGSYEALYGEKADGSNQLLAVVDISKAVLLKGCLVDTVSCQSARDLGPKAIQEGTRAYIGYNEITYVSTDDETKRVMNTSKVELLKGKTAGEAYDAQVKAYGEPSKCMLALFVRGTLGPEVLAALRAVRDRITGRMPNVLRQNFYDWNVAHYVILGDRGAKI